MTDSTDSLLGAWEDTPRRNFEVDATSVNLDSRDAFVLTRVDGVSTTADLCTVTGLGERDTLKHLGQLVKQGLVIIDEASGSRRLIHLRERHKKDEPSERPDIPVFRGVETGLADWLRQFGPMGVVSGSPVRGTGSARFGNMKFDQDLLREADAFTVAFKKEILFLFSYLGQLDHYEFFGIEPTADRKILRKAFFEFSRRFHPDTVFRKEIGPYKYRVERIFRHGSDAYELLTSNATFREKYFEAVKARNEFCYREHAETRKNRKVARLGRMKIAAAGRKQQLKERLERNTNARSEVLKNRSVGARLDKAKQFYDEGMAHYENESYISATNALRLAANYDPKNEDYAAALALSEERMKQNQAEHQWKRGYVQESLGHIGEALQAYLEAAEVLPKPEYCAHIASLMLQYDQDLRKAVELISKAIKGDPRNVEYRLILARLYQHAKLNTKAMNAYERVLELDGANEEAKKAIKKLK